MTSRIADGGITITATPRFRWIEAGYVKNKPNSVPVFEGFVKYTSSPGLILQQLWVDMHGNEYWENVEIEAVVK